MQIETLATAAAHCLSAETNETVRLGSPTLLKEETRSLVIRCPVQAPSANFPPAVIIKQLRDDAARGFDDWAGLAFLNGIPVARPLVPRFLGGDVDGRFFIMADLGVGTHLDGLWRENNETAVRTALERLAVTMARLHTVTVGKEDVYTAVRGRLPAAERAAHRMPESARWRDGLIRVKAWFSALNMPIPDGFDTAAEIVVRTYEQPGDLLAFSHGDPAPTNNHIAADGRVRLLDFEYGAYRHLFYDIAAWNILCPLPAEMVAAMVKRWLTELIPVFPTLADDGRFAREWALMCAFRALAILSWIGPEVLGENRPWADESWTARHAVLAAGGRMQTATAEWADLIPLTTAVAQLTTALQNRWPEYGPAATLTPSWPTSG